MHRKLLTAVSLLFLLAGCEKSAPPIEPSTALIETNEAAHHHDDHDHDHDHGYRDAGAHQHGAAEMTLVLEENLLSISLSLPAMDVLGFRRVGIHALPQSFHAAINLDYQCATRAGNPVAGQACISFLKSHALPCIAFSVCG